MPKVIHKKHKKEKSDDKECNYNPSFFNEVNVTVNNPVKQEVSVDKKEDGIAGCFKAMFQACKR